MPQTLAQIYLHLVFSTKERQEDRLRSVLTSRSIPQTVSRSR
jgi:hypothetical protein